MTTETTTTATPKKRGRPAKDAVKSTVKTTIKAAKKTTPKELTTSGNSAERVNFVARIHDLECEVERLHAVIGKMYINRTYA